jgi:hypothetical protein
MRLQVHALLASIFAGLLGGCSSGGVLPPGPLAEVSGTITNATALGVTDVQLVTIASNVLTSTGIDATGKFILSLPSEAQMQPYLTNQTMCGKEAKYVEGYTKGISSSKTYSLYLKNFAGSIADPRKPGDQYVVLAYFGSTIDLDCMEGTYAIKGTFVKGWNAMLITYTGSTTYTISSDPIPSSLTWRLE